MTYAALISRRGIRPAFSRCEEACRRVVVAFNVCLTMAAVLLTLGCTPDPQVQAAAGAALQERDAPPDPSPDRPQLEAEEVVRGVDRLGRGGSQTSPGGGPPVWAEGYEGLIAGLDGELYEGYLPSTIARVQSALRDRGLYDGPVHGALDAATMAALYTFQDFSYGLQPCGIPTPRTRRLLEQGSHT